MYLHTGCRTGRHALRWDVCLAASCLVLGILSLLALSYYESLPPSTTKMMKNMSMGLRNEVEKESWENTDEHAAGSAFLFVACH